jgi:signal transduction histidine kinase
VRWRILVAMVGAAFLAVIVVAVPSAVRLAHETKAGAIARLERVAGSVAARVPADLETRVGEALPDLASEGDLALYDTRGRRVAGEGPSRIDGPARRALLGGAAGGTTASSVVVAVPVVRDSGVVGVVRATQPISVIDDEVRQQRVTLALFGLVGLVFASVMGLAVSAAIARPLGRLRTAAMALGRGDFAMRAPRSRGEINEVASALDDTATRLGDVVERERAFSAQASHQLRTPLTSLRLAVETELETGRDDHTAVLHEVLTEADRLDQTITDLLTLARGNVDRGPVDLAAEVRAAEDRWHGRLAAVNRPLRTRIDAELRTAHGSAAAIGQILDVLLDNALRHGAGVVTISARPVAGPGAVVSVADEGPGVDDAASIFDASTRSGHGYGLSLAATLAAAEGARLRLAATGPHPVFEIFFTG